MTAFKSFYDLFEGYLAYPLLLAIALFSGIGLAFTYKHVKKGYAYVKFTPVAILCVPLAMAALVGLLNLRNTELETSDTIRVGVVLTAGVALTRFRSDKLAIEDMIYLIFASVLGIVFGLGYALYGALTAIVMILLMLILHQVRFGEDMGGIYSVRIKVSEELNQSSVFDEALQKHCGTFHLTEVRTVEYGQLYEIRYDVSLKKGETLKGLIDEIRLHNGNLEVVASSAETR
jgi:hypothetical protein